MTGPHLLLAFASAAERRAFAPRHLLDACATASGVALTALQVGLAATRLAALDRARNPVLGLVSCGVAGGLDPALPAGTLLLPRTVVTRGGERIAVDRCWHRCALACMPSLTPFATGPLVDGGGIVASPARKQALRQAHGAVAVDMESAALARWAGQRGLPFLVLRVVLDPADVALPEWSQLALRPDGTTHIARLAPALLRRPAGVLELLRLAGDLRSTAVRWREALRVLGPALAPGAPTA